MTYNKAIKPDQPTKYVEAIQKAFPALPITAVEIVGSGENRIAILVNGEIVFRLPSDINDAGSKEDILNTKIEYQILLRLGALPFQIPRPIYISPDERFFGYKFLQGKNASNSLLEGPVPDTFLRQWVSVRKAISKQLSVADAKELNVPILSWDLELQRAKSLPNEALSVEAQSKLTSDIAYVTAFKTESELEFTHNDLNIDNLLVDSSGETITGVLDFGDAHIAPRSSDYYLWDKWPHEVMKRVAMIAVEQHDEFDVRLARAMHRIYVASDLWECIEQNDTRSIQKYTTELERCYSE